MTENLKDDDPRKQKKATRDPVIGDLHRASINRVLDLPKSGFDSRGQSFPAAYPNRTPDVPNRAAADTEKKIRKSPGPEKPENGTD